METKTTTKIVILCVICAALSGCIDIAPKTDQPTPTYHTLPTPFLATPTPTPSPSTPTPPFAIIITFGSNHQSKEMTLLPDGTMVIYPVGAFNSIDGWGKTRDPIPVGNWEYAGATETHFGTAERYNLLNTEIGRRYMCPVYVDLLDTGNGQTTIVGGDAHNKRDAVSGVRWRNV